MPAVTSETPWRLLALAPLALELWEALFGGLPLDVVVPAERSQPAVAAAIAAAEIVVGDWTGALRVTGAEVGAAPRLAFVQQPSVGVDTLDIDALAAAGVPAANAAGANAVSVAEWCVGASYAVLRWLAWADAGVPAGGGPRRGGGATGSGPSWRCRGAAGESLPGAGWGSSAWAGSASSARSASTRSVQTSRTGAVASARRRTPVVRAGSRSTTFSPTASCWSWSSR